METDQLFDILQTDKKSTHIFRGVYARDQFNDIFPLGSTSRTSRPISLYICNLDNSNKPGSHWIVVDFNKYSGKVIYFDSYGLPPTHADIAERLASESKELIWNNVQLQELNTTVCGQYCTLYCLLRARDLTPRQIIDLLHCDGLISHDTRDHIVYDFVKNIYPNKLSALQTDVHDIIDFL